MYCAVVISVGEGNKGKVSRPCQDTPAPLPWHEVPTVLSFLLFPSKFSLLTTVLCLGLLQLPSEQLNVTQEMVQHLLDPQQHMALSGQS